MDLSSLNISAIKFTCDPPLKAKKQTSRIPPPSAARGTECPGMSLAVPSELNLPFLGPMM